MFPCRKFLLWSKDRTSIVSVRLDKRFKIEEIEGDTQGLAVKIGSPWGPVTAMAKAMGWDVIPNQWVAKTTYIKQVSESSWRVTIRRAKHTMGDTITVTHVGGPTLADAKEEFWKMWNARTWETGWHTHFKPTEARYTNED